MPTSHANLTGQDLHVDKAIKVAVRAATVANVTLSAPGSTIDAVTMVSGDRFAALFQTAPAQNGIYVWNGAASAATRATDADAAADFVFGFLFYVREGTTNGASLWEYTQATTPVVVGTTAITFAKIFVGSALADPTTTRGDIITRGVSAIGRLAVGAANSILASNGTDPSWATAPTLAGEVTGLDFKVTGMTGATAGARLVGGTTSGAPVTGTFAVGDFAIDQTGRLWVCTGAGAPGTWLQTSGTMVNPMTTNQDLIVGAASGSPARLAVGGNGQVLTVTAGAVSWANSPAGFSNPMTNPGDLIEGGTGGAAQRLAVGGNGQILTIVGGLPGWANNTGGTSLGANAVASTNLYLAANFI